MSVDATKTISGMNNFAEKAKLQMENLIKNKNMWGVLYIWIIIFLLIFLLAYYYKGKMSLKDENNARITADYKKLGGTSIGGINTRNAMHKHLLRDYYIKSSYNSCCGGSVEKDFVDMVPLTETIKQGARLLDFEIYSKEGEPVVAAGPDPTPDGKYCLKGTYNSLPLQNVLQRVRILAFSGRTAPNPDDPLFLSFRIKTNNRNIYPIMAKKIGNTFRGMFLGPKYRYEGKDNRNGKGVLPNVPLLNLRRKVIIFVDDPNNNYRGTEFWSYVNISGKSKDGTSMPFFKTYRNYDIVQAYDPKSIKEENKKFLAITMPDFSKVTENPPAAIHHSYGSQFVMMNYSVLDANMEYYLNFFNSKGSAFVLKPDHLRYFERKIAPPAPQKKELSYAPRRMSMLGGVYNPRI